MHSPLEQYLEQVEIRLQALPAAQRAEEISEIRQHVEAMVEARKELGCSEAEAVTLTLEQFGKVQSVSRGLVRAYRRGHESWFRSLVLATVCAYIVSHAGTQLCLSLLNVCAYRAAGPGWSMMQLPAWSPIALYFLLPLLEGLVVAQITTRRAVAGIVIAHGTLYSASLLSLAFNHLDLAVIPHEKIWASILQSAIILCFTTLFAAISAKVGARWKQVRIRRLRLAG